MRLTFNAPRHHKLQLPDGKTVSGGDHFDADEKLAAELLSNPVNRIEDPEKHIAKLADTELKKLARERGLDADKLSKSELAAALAQPVPDHLDRPVVGLEAQAEPDNPASEEK